MGAQHSRNDDQLLFLIYGKMDHIREGVQEGSTGVFISGSYSFWVFPDEFYFLADMLGEPFAQSGLTLTVP